MAFSVGDYVHSRAIGACGAFNGEVVEVRPSSRLFPISYDVKDGTGQEWNRDGADLTLIETSAEAA